MTCTSSSGTWVNTAFTHFFHDEAGQIIGEYAVPTSATQETVWLGNLPVATVRAGVVHHVHPDHLGTPRSITQANDATEVWRWDSDPFGTNPPTTSTGGVPTIAYSLRFAGQYHDIETGLHHNGMRDYDPRTGRYLQADPIGLHGGLARYTYVGASPIDFVDPDGLFKVNLIAGGIGAAYGGGSGVVESIQQRNSFGDHLKSGFIGATSGFVSGFTLGARGTVVLGTSSAAVGTIFSSLSRQEPPKVDSVATAGFLGGLSAGTTMVLEKSLKVGPAVSNAIVAPTVIGLTLMANRDTSAVCIKN